MKKKLIFIGLMAVILVAGSFAYKILSDRRMEQQGKDKFDKALSELLTANPEMNNPCLGYSVARSGTYAHLKDKSIEEIKAAIARDPGSC
jgi:hypothetical protein